MSSVVAKAPKRATNLTIREDLLREARAAGINLSQTLEVALEAALREARAAQWRQDNAEAIAAYNHLVESEGLPLEEWRMF